MFLVNKAGSDKYKEAEIFNNLAEFKLANHPVLILAHGAGAPMDSAFMNSVAAKLSAVGINVIRFEFPYMQERRDNGKKRPPNRQIDLLASFEQVLSGVGKIVQAPVFIGGKSMGGRMATILASTDGACSTSIKGVVCLGYPFHPPGKPEKLRVEHLPRIKSPTLIMQGTRDALGKPEEVSLYTLGSICVSWLDTADHDFKPLKKTGRTQEDMIDLAVAKVGEFIKV
jgi:predicted alpha/beta-hydrolase family hydrolase